MPVVSQAQAHKFLQLYKEGKISKKTLDEWTKGVEVKKLPKHKRKKKK
jgi:hypothetical protein